MQFLDWEVQRLSRDTRKHLRWRALQQQLTAKRHAIFSKCNFLLVFNSIFYEASRNSFMAFLVQNNFYVNYVWIKKAKTGQLSYLFWSISALKILAIIIIIIIIKNLLFISHWAHALFSLKLAPQVSVAIPIGLDDVMDNNSFLNAELFEIYQFTILFETSMAKVLWNRYANNGTSKRSLNYAI